MGVTPTPDGVATVFAVPNSNVVPNTLFVYLDGERLDESPDPVISRDLTAGWFELDNPPPAGSKLAASYYFQWFTDEQLEEFLTNSSGLLQFDTVEDSAIPLGLRTPIVSLAAYYAYMKMAANSAVVLSASAAGFTSDNSKEHPNWMDLAKQAWDEFQNGLVTFNENPVSTERLQMRIINYRVPRYTPRS